MFVRMKGMRFLAFQAFPKEPLPSGTQKMVTNRLCVTQRTPLRLSKGVWKNLMVMLGQGVSINTIGRIPFGLT